MNNRYMIDKLKEYFRYLLLYLLKIEDIPQIIILYTIKGEISLISLETFITIKKYNHKLNAIKPHPIVSPGIL